MESREPRIKKRILIIMMDELKLDSEEIIRVMAAFDDLCILERDTFEMMWLTNRRTFYLGKEKYKEKMQWINEYLRSKGMEEDVFTDMDNFETCCDDWDYYYRRRTQTEYDIAETERKNKKAQPNS